MSAARGSPGRLPFDPQRAKGPQELLFDGRRGGDAPVILTVSALTRMVKSAINQSLPGTLHVVGELSNVTAASSGHIYFTLKDSATELRCVMWESSATTVKFRLSDGQEVVASGTLDVYEPRGQYQFYVRKLEPRGVGALELAFRQLKEKLAKEGLFDPKHKRPLPRFPRRIAVVTSLAGAAVRDILQTIGRRYPVVEALVYGVRVQGEGSAQEVAEAMRRINDARETLGGIDVLIVGRGGGSLEDLWAFNEEVVARAIHASAIPVVSAVGHETDFTIADFVADVRAATPTAAAELVVPLLSDLIDDLEKRARRLRQVSARVLETARGRLAVVQKAEWFRDPVGRIRHRQQQVDEVGGRLALAAAKMLAERRKAIHQAEVRLFRVRPEAMLARRREAVSKMEHRLRWAESRNRQRLERRMRALELKLTGRSPMRRVAEQQQALVDLSGRLFRGVGRLHLDGGRRLDDLEKRLHAGSHEAILHRGFTITRRKRDGKMVRRPADVSEGDRLATQTLEGIIASRVEDAAQDSLFE